MPDKEGIFGPDLLAMDDDDDEEDDETEDQDPEDSEGEPESTEPEEGVDEDGPDEDTEGESEEEPTEAADDKGEEPEEAGEPEWSLGWQFKTPEDLARSYQEQKALMGRQAQEVGQLRQAVALMQQNLQRYQAWMADPQNILQAAEQLRAQQQPQDQAPEPEEEEDPAQWLERFYQEGPKAVAQLMRKREARLRQEIQALEARLGQALQRIEQSARQAVAPAQQYAQTEQLRSHLQKQEGELREELKKQGVNLDDYADDIVKVMRENPQFFRFPNGMRLAFDIARARKPTPKPNAAAVKKAARVTTSIGTRPQEKTPDPDDLIRESIFGARGKTEGVFG